MEKTPVDPKRTGVKAVASAWTEPPLALIDDKWYAPPGTMIPRYKDDLKTVIDHLIACPGCGSVGSGRDGATWQVTSGIREDVTTLTLSPSILKSGCCGWHGHLVNGVFVSC